VGDRWGPGLTHAAKPGAKVIVKWKNPTNRRHDVKSVHTGKNWSMTKQVLRPNNKNVVKRTFRKTGRYHFRPHDPPGLGRRQVDGDGRPGSRLQSAVRGRAQVEGRAPAAPSSCLGVTPSAASLAPAV
jgi:hypothetical protein